MTPIRFPGDNLDFAVIRNTQKAIDIFIILFVIISISLSVGILFRFQNKKLLKILAILTLAMGLLSLLYFSSSYYDYYFAPRILY